MSRSPLQQLRALLRYILSWLPQHFARPLAFLRLLWRRFMRRTADRGLPPDAKDDDGVVKPSPVSHASYRKAVLDNHSSAVVYASDEPSTYPSLEDRRARSWSHRSPDTDPSGSYAHSKPDAYLSGSERGSSPYSITIQNPSQHSLASTKDSSLYHTSVHDDHVSVNMSRPSSRISMRTRDDRDSRLITPSDSRRQSSRSKQRNLTRRRTPTASPSHSTATLHSNSSWVSQHNVAMPAGRLLHERRSQKTYPIVETGRYTKAKDWEQRECAYKVEPMKMSTNSSGHWEAHTHPEGALYFFDRLRIYTEAWIYDPAILEEIETSRIGWSKKCRRITRITTHADLCSSWKMSRKSICSISPLRPLWTYYYVNHAERVLFWLKETTSKPKLVIESYYWKHMEYFPVGQTITEALRIEVLCILVHANVDQIISESSTVSMKPDEMLNLTKMVEISKELGSNDYTASVIGRYLLHKVHNRYNFSFGQKAAQIDRFQPVYDTNTKERSALFTLLSCALFNAPDMHLQTLERAWIDGTINEIFWTKCINKLQKDWEEAVLTVTSYRGDVYQATVVLNANISFLTINDVDSGTGPRTPAQLASYVSTICSIAAVVIGLLIIRQHRVRPKETATDAVTYLETRRHPRLGLEVLGIVHSLPYALLMWAVVSFLLAFAFENFRVKDTATLVVASTAWGLAVILLVLCLYTIWEGGEISIRQKMRELYQQANDKLQLSMRQFMKQKQHADQNSCTAPGSSSNVAVPTGIEMQSI
ncbi:uncharacterized protein B0H18DRAFT_1017903 [Fomitopsis serialis]|uniref:uncharacterized protein n=1 Tax=Fomitopsis serialis TaxID=139415 RepID=UPI00200845F0|nr:uncharacterized protein B0H18DRAFT_1017903 [Neoantrodia serialis]KAH9922505.1 hypothetical protein B0H18DRAFT_1017903 [Neoantrodia serialis]